MPIALAGQPDLGGRIVIDAIRSVEGSLFNPAKLYRQASGEGFLGRVPGARVMKAVNHLALHLAY